ncbi:DUF1800 domain-containing protein [Allorhizocola rhizosphaerae]|uniref:DUF1800 domain-containing protein n=1 Tax=Allorhizocola rhizosphaerae TaxID=1872709 RepID=UPI000E3D45D9|nr:DUF1800 family protein [Allorhizocola rhizosphaerae]
MTDELSLLLHRAGFGPTAAELTAARKAGYAAALSSLVAPAGPDPGAAQTPVPDLGKDFFANRPKSTPEERAKGNDQRRAQTRQITLWWLDRMIAARHQAVEKLLFFWHGHWATSVESVRSPQLMLRQHMTLREAPDFVAMVRQMVIDPALIWWLDGHLNTRKSPNENLARELMELFTVGIGQYTERDVKEAGRALTGWEVNLDLERCQFLPGRHDPEEKTILGVTSRFTAGSLVDLLLQHKATPRFIASRMWIRYGSSTIAMPKRTQENMAAAYPSPMTMLRVLFQDDAFRASGGTLVKQPVEWFVGAMRQLGLRMSGMPDKAASSILNGLEDMGQLPFAPPNVGGWPAGTVWLTSATAQLRLDLAATIAQQAQVEKLTAEGLAHMLCIKSWSDRTYAAMREVKDPRRLLVLGLASPEYLVV